MNPSKRKLQPFFILPITFSLLLQGLSPLASSLSVYQSLSINANKTVTSETSKRRNMLLSSSTRKKIVFCYHICIHTSVQTLCFWYQLFHRFDDCRQIKTRKLVTVNTDGYKKIEINSHRKFYLKPTVTTS